MSDRFCCTAARVFRLAVVGLCFMLFACDPDITGGTGGSDGNGGNDEMQPPGGGARDLSGRLQQISVQTRLPGSLSAASAEEADSGFSAMAAMSGFSTALDLQSSDAVDPADLPEVQAATYAQFIEGMRESRRHEFFESLREALDGREIPADEWISVGDADHPHREGDTIDLGVIRVGERDEDSISLQWRFMDEEEFDEDGEVVTVSEDMFVTIEAEFEGEALHRIAMSGLIAFDYPEGEGTGRFGYRQGSNGDFAYFEGPEFTGATSYITVGSDDGDEVEMAAGSIYIPWNDEQSIRNAPPVEDVFFTIGYGTDGYGGARGYQHSLDGVFDILRSEYYTAGAGLRFRTVARREADIPAWAETAFDEPDYNTVEHFDWRPDYLFVAEDLNESKFWIYTGEGVPGTDPRDEHDSAWWQERSGSVDQSPLIIHRAGTDADSGDAVYSDFSRHSLSDEWDGLGVSVFTPSFVYPARKTAFDGNEYYTEYQWPVRGLSPADPERSFYETGSDWSARFWLSTEAKEDYSPQQDTPLNVRRESLGYWDPSTGSMVDQSTPVFRSAGEPLPEYLNFPFEIYTDTIVERLGDIYERRVLPFEDIDYYADFVESFPDLPDRGIFP